MQIYYFDTSALIKLYIDETGSDWVQTIYDKQSEKIIFAKIGIVETAAALTRRERMNEITPELQKSLYSKMLEDANNRFQVIAVADEIIYSAAALTQRHPLRGYDAVHLAAALELNRYFELNRTTPITFVSADEKLCLSASIEGLNIENPNHHP